MDWQVAIERNGAALRRVLAALVAMTGLGDLGGQFTFFPQEGEPLRGGPRAEKSKLSPAPTLPRRLHRAVLRLLRPAESAARRLIIVAAKTLAQTPPAPARPARRLGGRRDNAAVAVLRSLGIAVVLPPSAPAFRRAVPRVRRAPAAIALPLADRLRRPGPPRPRTVPPHAAPRILTFDGTVPHRLPSPPSPHDTLDATRLVLRLKALGAALDDLPRQARRFLRLQALRARARARGRLQGMWSRISPLRGGRPPGQLGAGSRRPRHEIHEILRDLNFFAHEALPDTS